MLLKGVRVVEIADGLTGPFAARVFSDLGAEVIKVELPAAAGSRHKTYEFPRRNGPLFDYVNSGKRSLAVDWQSSVGWQACEKLAAGSHVLVETISTDPALRSRLDPLRARCPGLVVVTVTPFGLTEPPRPSSDLTVQHASGFAYHQARPVSDLLAQPPVAAADCEAALAAGLAAAVAALWGLFVAAGEAKAPRIDFANRDFYSHLLFEPLEEWLEGERRFIRRRNDFKGAQVAGGLIWLLPCSDGWVMVSPREQHQWTRWVELLGSPGWAADPAFCGDRAARKKNWDAIQAAMAEWTRTRSREEVYALAQAAKVACFPLSRPADLLDNPQLAARRFFNRLTLQSGETVAAPGLPFIARTSGGDTIARDRVVAAPARGEANPEYLDAAMRQDRAGWQRQAAAAPHEGAA